MSTSEPEQVCRTCLKVSNSPDEFMDLNTINFPHRISLRVKLRSCIPEITISDDEKADICTSCATLLESSYVFRKTVLSTEDKLHKISSQYYRDLVKIISRKSQEDIKCIKDDTPQTNVKDDASQTKKESSSPDDSKESTSTSKSGAKKGTTEGNKILENSCEKNPELKNVKPYMLRCSVVLEKGASDSESPPKKKLKVQTKKITKKRNVPRLGMDSMVKRHHACRFCDKRFKRMSHLTDHEKRVHFKKTDHACQYCNKGFYYNCEVKRHYLTCKAKVAAESNKNQKAKTNNERSSKRRSKTGQPNYNELEDAENISAPSTSKSAVQEEAVTATPEKSQNSKAKPENKQKTLKIKTEPNVENAEGTTWFPCTLCSATFSNEEQRDQHSQTHINFSCSICSLLFATGEERDTHLKLHSTSKSGRYMCLVCNCSVKGKDHFNLHTGNRPYICQTCNKCFACSSTLRYHRSRYHEAKQKVSPTCPHCKKTFVKMYLMHKHAYRCSKNPKNAKVTVKKAKKQPPKATSVECTICHNEYSTVAIDSHICINDDGQRVLKCHVCSESMIGRSTFIEHVKKHFVEGENLDHEVHVMTTNQEENSVKPENTEELEQNEIMKDETVDDQVQPTFSYAENTMECETGDESALIDVET